MKPFSVRLCPEVFVCPKSSFLCYFLLPWKVISRRDYIFGLVVCLTRYIMPILAPSIFFRSPLMTRMITTVMFNDDLYNTIGWNYGLMQSIFGTNW
jgi:hypothetical protein